MKKIFVKVGTWLRSIVTTMMGEEGRVKREEVKDTQSVYVDVNVNDDVTYLSRRLVYLSNEVR